MDQLTINQCDQFIKNARIFPNTRIIKIDLTDEILSNLTKESVCFITKNNEPLCLVLYVNFIFYLILNFQGNEIKLFEKLNKVKKIITFSKEFRKLFTNFLNEKQKTKIYLDQNIIISEDEEKFLLSNMKILQNNIQINQHKTEISKSILNLFYCSMIYKNLLSERRFNISNFLIYDEGLMKKQTININWSRESLFTNVTVFQKQSHNLFILKSKQNNQNTYYLNELVFIKLLRKFRENICTKFKIKEIVNGIDSQNMYPDFNDFDKTNHDSDFPIINSIVSSENNAIISELLSTESLNDRCINQRAKMNYTDLLIFIYGVARSINLIHSLGFIHRDIKPENYKFKNPNSKIPILFNMSAVMPMRMMEPDDDKFYSNLTETRDIGSCQYFSPEKIDTKYHISFSCDIFSLGILFYMIITGLKPFANISPFNQSSILKCIKEGKLPSIIQQDNNDKNENNAFTCNEFASLYDIQDDELKEIIRIYQSCIHLNPTERPTIREFCIDLLNLSQKARNRIINQNNFNILHNCELELIDELASPISFVKGISDSYYVKTENNELENFSYFLIDHKILFNRALSYISQIKFDHFCTFHFDEFQNNKICENDIQNLTLCIGKCAIIVRNSDNLIEDFLLYFKNKFSQIKLIPSSKKDYSTLQAYTTFNLISWNKVEELSQITDKIVSNIERRDTDLIEPKTYSLIPLVSYLIVEQYFTSRKMSQLEHFSDLIDIRIKDSPKFLLDLDSFALIIKDENELEAADPKSTKMLQISNYNLQDYQYISQNRCFCYHYYPYEKNDSIKKLLSMPEKIRIELLYIISSILIELHKNNLYLNSLTASDIYLFESKNTSNRFINFDFKLKTYNNLSLITDQRYVQKNIDDFISIFETLKLNNTKDFLLQRKEGNRLTLKYINNFLYSKFVSKSNHCIQVDLNYLEKLSLDILPFKFNGNDIFPKEFLGDFSESIFGFDFYNILDDNYENLIELIKIPEDVPFLTFEFINNNLAVLCIENQIFLLNGFQNLTNKFSLILKRLRSNLTLIPIKESDKEQFLQMYHENECDQNPQLNFFDKLKQIDIQTIIEELKEKILSYFIKRHDFSSFQKYIDVNREFLHSIISIIGPAISYTIFKFYFSNDQFSNSSYLDCPFENETDLIDFSYEINNFLHVTNVGQGSTSNISLCIYLPYLYPVIMKNYVQSMYKYFYTEKKVGQEIKKTKNENLAEFYGFIDKSDMKSLILKFYPNGSIEDISSRDDFYIRSISYYSSLNNGLKQLHELNYIHRDIKPDNILIDNNYKPVIIDFNGAISIEEKNKCEKHVSEVGSYKFSSPQLLNGEYYDNGTDNYSLEKVTQICIECKKKKKNGSVPL